MDTANTDELDRAYPEACAFFAGKPHSLALYQAFARSMLATLPHTKLDVRKTQISLLDGRMYACVSMMRARRKAELPPEYIVVTFSSPSAVESPRVAQQVQIRPGRWTVHVVVGDESELDDELLGWVHMSHACFAERSL